MPLHEREMVLGHFPVDFEASVTLDADHVTVPTRVGSLGTTSFRMDHEVRTPDGRRAATAETVLVVVERDGHDTTGTRPVPEAWRETFADFEPALEG